MKDVFEGLSRDELYTVEFEIEEKVPDEMPKYYYDFFDHPRVDFDREEFMRMDITGTIKELRLKDKYNEMGMFCFVSWKWINPIAEWIGNRKCLEVMAGRGWLSYALQQKNVDIKATDDYSWHKKPMFTKWNDTVTDVEEIDAVAAVEKYGRDIDILFMAWPYMDNTAYQVMKKLHEVNKDALIVYCGEHGGCTADDEFHNHFEEADPDEAHIKFYEAATNYQRWYSAHDHLMLGRYSEEKVSDDDDED